MKSFHAPILRGVRLASALLVVVVLLLLTVSCELFVSISGGTDAPAGSSDEPLQTTVADTGLPLDSESDDPTATEPLPPETEDSEPGDTRPADSEPTDTAPEGTDEPDSTPVASPTETAEPPSCAHTPAVLPALEPTCTASGKSEGSICETCGDILTPQSVIPPTGHRYETVSCSVCGEAAVCPSPVPVGEWKEQLLPFGETLTLSWRQDESALFDVVYRLTLEEDGGKELPLLTDVSDTTHSLTFPQEGTGYTLRLYALYVSEGTAAPTTVSEPLTLRVAIPLRPMLEAPVFLTGNGITVYIGDHLPVTWVPMTVEGASLLYTLTLTDPRGSVTELTASEEDHIYTIPEGLLAEAGAYRLTLSVRDAAGGLRDSLPATLAVTVQPPPDPSEQDFRNPARYASDYYYDYLATDPSQAALQSFYRMMDTSLTDFHTSKRDAEAIELGDGSTRYYAAKLNFSLCGLTLEDAVTVRALYLLDHPLYYWVSGVYVYSDDTLYVCVEEEYADGEARAYNNGLVYAGVEDMAADVVGETSSYRIAMAYYERILARADYAFESDGVTPEDDHWAHSLIGVFNGRGAVVCEGFAEAYSLLLNYHGVENIQVTGVSRGVGHLWNLVRLDNGEWYWCDITWDDTTYSELGTDYKYFCVTDTQDVLYYYVRDGIEAGYDYTFSGSGTFLDDHTVRWDAGLTLDMTAAIPPRAETPYGGHEPVLRDSFTVDGMTYAVVGYRKVQLVDVGDKRSVMIPEAVTDGGVSYTVVSIGLINGEGVFMIGRLLPSLTMEVYVPKTVYYIWEKALDSATAVIRVDPENPWYTAGKASSARR